MDDLKCHRETVVTLTVYTQARKGGSSCHFDVNRSVKGLEDIRLNAADPGRTATDLNGHSGPKTVNEGANEILCLATLDDGCGYLPAQSAPIRIPSVRG
ncbi:hypothetical protein ACFW95_32570 [Streptomyces sp. NPDC059474]|uniref:hypothetical protein n=1 Tax=Streptomyces sp. NPDC059474 TaxID=3346846 RepID=UPI0036B293B0